MTRAEKELSRRLERIMREVQVDLGLAEWYVRFRFSQDLDGAEAGVGMEVNSTTCVTKALWKYRQVTFTWYLPSASTQSDEKLYFIALHEWVHAMMSPLFPHLKSGSHVDDLNERTTEDITRALMVTLERELPED